MVTRHLGTLAVLLGVGMGSFAAGNLYDPKRDPQKDLTAAVRQATHEGKRILLVVGGERCYQCRLLNYFVHETPDVRDLWDTWFVTVHVNVSAQNANAKFLARYPPIESYPHVLVLDGDGSFLHSQKMEELESGDGYSKEAVLEFLDTWRLQP